MPRSCRTSATRFCGRRRDLGDLVQDEAVAGLVIAIEDPDLGIRELAADLRRFLSEHLEATPADVPAMAALEMEVSGITREQDYRYAIENKLGFWHAAVYENEDGKLDGFMISSLHHPMNMLGPCVARSEAEAAALIVRELDVHRGRTPWFVVPAGCGTLVRQLYDWGAHNCELHLCHVRGEFQPFRGVSMPTFLPETG